MSPVDYPSAFTCRRMMPPNREFYVAYDPTTGVQQDMLDMAFRVHFGN